MIKPKQPAKRQVLRDEYVHRCQDPKCPKTVPPHIDEMVGWLVISGIDVYSTGTTVHDGALWFCSWSHLSNWSDENAIAQVSQP